MSQEFEEQDNPLQLTPDDIAQAKLVVQMREHPGFPVLVEFWNAQREAIIKDGKKAAKTKDPVVAAGYWMELSGFDKACTIIDRICARTEHEDEIEKLAKEGEHVAKA